MLDDMDAEMRKRRIEAIVVMGDTTLANPDLTYVVGGSLPRGGIYSKRVGYNPLLVTSNLDIGLARKYGRIKRIETFTKWGLEALGKKYGRANAYPRLIATVLKEEGVRGKVAIFGRNDLAYGVYVADQLRKLKVKVTGERSPTILEAARETKSPKEIQELRRIGAKTSRVVQSIMMVLSNMKRKRGHLQLDGSRATVGRVKAVISSKLAAEDLVAPEGTIFATGPSSADGHNAGVPTDEIREGKLIVFDIFPQAESGYWTDITRTFVVGRADNKAKRLFETVYEAQTDTLDFLKAGVRAEDAMSRVCNIIERRGFRTVRDIYVGKAKSVDSGFNHSLGHGVGLTIGERPYLGFLNKDRLRTGQVVTVEPGVYLPKYGGVRIEDTVVITPRGVDNLVSAEKEFELI
jgi:Xaa-Pro aminopeptidase